MPSGACAPPPSPRRQNKCTYLISYTWTPTSPSKQVHVPYILYLDTYPALKTSARTLYLIPGHLPNTYTFLYLYLLILILIPRPWTTFPPSPASHASLILILILILTLIPLPSHASHASLAHRALSFVPSLYCLTLSTFKGCLISGGSAGLEPHLTLIPYTFTLHQAEVWVSSLDCVNLPTYTGCNGTESERRHRRLNNQTAPFDVRHLILLCVCHLMSIPARHTLFYMPHCRSRPISADLGRRDLTFFALNTLHLYLLTRQLAEGESEVL